jgi:hypothetical protein
MKILNSLRFFTQIFIFYLLSIFIFSSLANAYETNAAAAYEFLGDFEENKKTIIQKAKKMACNNAYKKYINTFDQDKLKNYGRVQKKIESNLSAYMVCDQVVDENIDFSNSSYSVVVIANINSSKVEQEMINSSAVKTSTDEASEIVMFMLSRTVKSVKQKDKRVTKIEQNTNSEDVNQLEAENEGEIVISSETVSTKKSVTGGNTIESSPDISYEIKDGYNETISGGMEEILNSAGFELVPSWQFENLDEVNKDIKIAYVTEDTLPSNIRRAISKEMKAEGISFYISGIFDIGKLEVDSATGNKVVNVSVVRATLWGANSKGRFKSISTVSGNQRKGKGTSYDQAIKNAIRLCSQSVAKQMVSKLNAKGVK